MSYRWNWLKLAKYLFCSQVQHAKRTQALPQLPAYQTELVRTVVREVRELNREVTSLLEPFSGSFNPSSEPATACALLVSHLSMRRNKRCLLAYHRVRTDKLEEMCWDGVDIIGNEQTAESSAMASESTKSSLSPEEEEYVRLYGDLLAAYKGQWTDIDLTGSLEPPTDLFIDVRVLKDAGEIQTEYGCVFNILDSPAFTHTDHQCHQFDQEQPILCSPRRCRAAHPARLFAKAELRSRAEQNRPNMSSAMI